MTTVDKLVYEYHQATKEDNASEMERVRTELAENHFEIMDRGMRYLLICTNPVNENINYVADTSISKADIEERFKNFNA
jgi:hypothetical protein